MPQPASGESANPSPSERNGARVGSHALLATLMLYGGYTIAGVVGVPANVRFMGLIAAFYFVPGFLLRDDPVRQRRYQVGPDGLVPPFSRAGLRWAGLTIAVIFPPFVLLFFGF